MSAFADTELSPDDVAEMIGIDVEQWVGNCYAIAVACVKARVIAGRAVYGCYFGPVHTDSTFLSKPIIRHGWVEYKDRVWDPTRWTLDAPHEPYIYLGPVDDYDEGSNRILAAMRAPRPEIVAAGRRAPYHLRLDDDTRNHIGALLGTRAQWRGGVTLDQIHWLANAPLPTLGVHAKALFREIDRLGFRTRIPIDNARKILRGR